MTTLTNWSGNITFGAARVHHPGTLEELAGIVAGSDRVRVLGTGHSFNAIADTSGDLVSVAALPPSMDIDTTASTVRVSGGTRYGELTGHLQDNGFALHNLGSLPHISIAGACSTGTHGSGVANGNLATAVRGLTFLAPDGETVTVERGVDEDFPGSVISLGSLGVITHLTLDLQPTFDVAQYVYLDMPADQVRAHLREVLGAAYSVSLFTDWRNTDIDQVWVKRRSDETTSWRPEQTWLGAHLADRPMHPVPGMPEHNATEQLGVAGPWQARLPHFRIEFTPSSGEELQTEYFVPIESVGEAFDAVNAIRDRIAPVLQISEIRTIARDDLWLSPSYGRDSVAFHFTWVPDTAAVTPVVTAIEEALAPFSYRPHWGKVFTTASDQFAAQYEKLPEFLDLMRRRDPGGKFRNALIDQFFPITV